MSELASQPFMCPRTTEACPTAPLCELSNVPLQGAVSRITEQDVGASLKAPTVAAKALSADLERLGTSLDAELSPRVSPDSATICPRDILERPLPEGTTKEQVAAGVGTLVGKAIDSLIVEARTNRQGAVRSVQGRSRRRR